MIVIYRDTTANAVFIQDSNGTQFVNTLQAYMIEPTDDILSIRDVSKEIDIFTGVDYTEFTDETGAPYGATAIETTNALNAICQSSGSPVGNPPQITSANTIELNQGEQINYELLADYGVAFELDTLPSGVTTVEGNTRKLIGGSNLTAAGSPYNITARAINYFGVDEQAMSINVSTSFTNTRSVSFNTNDWMGANASLLSSILGRSGNGSGASDSWTISIWLKPGTSGNQNQTVLYYGDNDASNGGSIKLVYSGGKESIKLVYGSNNNFLQLTTPDDSVSKFQWHHILVTYDGGTTGSSSGSLSNYYGRFSIAIDGVAQTTANSHNNYGWSSGIDPDNFRIARSTSGNYLRNSSRVDEVAIWASDQTVNTTDIYNSGSPFDLSTLGTTPDHWWRMGDGDTYPIIQDNSGTAHFVMYNMIAADIVNDVP